MKSEAEFIYPHGKLRLIGASDLDDLRRWRNHPRVRKAMITQHEMSPEEHSVWWEKIRNDDTKRWYIYAEDDKPAAVIYFFRLDSAEKTSWWGFYLCDYSEEARAGRGALAQRVMKTMMEHAFNEMGLDRLLCEVRESNLAAIRLYKEVGFTESQTAPSGVDVDLTVMELKRPEA